ncbi:MAG TPA: PAS domain S-box protein [Candidatus Baltobacteraceae bacterium]|nr:PAS domain S-box protein [Candidatus Baltobacteraceae bacterium]
MLDVSEELSAFDPAVFELMETSRESLWLGSPDGRVIYLNAANELLLGLAPEQIMQRGWQELIHPDDLERMLGEVTHTLQTGEPMDVEARMRAADGEYRWIRSRADAIRRDGRIVGFFGHNIDVDRYVKAEMQARSAESRLRRLIDSTLVGFVQLSMDGRIVDANETYAQMLGYSAQELRDLRLPISDLTPPEYRGHGQQMLASLSSAGTTSPFSKEYYRRDGTRVPFLIIAAKDPDDPQRINAYTLDLSTQSEYKAALDAARSFNQTLMDTMPVMLWEADENGKVTYFNRWFYDYTGLSTDAPLDASVWNLLHPDDAALYAPMWQREHKVPVGSERYVRYRRADGSYRWHLIHSQPITGADGCVQRWFGYSIDVDDQRRAAERQSFLLRATGALSPLLEPQALFNRLVYECVPAMADYAQFFTVEGGEVSLAAVAAASDAQLALMREFHELDRDQIMENVAAVIYRNEVVCADTASLNQSKSKREGRAREIADSLETVSAIAIPVAGESGPIGAIVVATGSSGRVYDEGDVQTFRLLAERIAVIIENAQRFAREHRVAEAMQNASLPQSLPSPRGMRLDAFYAAAASEAHIGGDWYDAVELPDGRVVLSIGDVTGRGLAAAVTMANIRQIIRGIAHVHPDPALMLEAADRALRAEHPDTYVTAFTCVIDPIESTLAYAAAGHPPAVLRKANGNTVLLNSPGLPLGLRRKSEPGTTAVPIAPGDAIVLYTDGLTEARRTPLDGEHALIECAQQGDVLNGEHPAHGLFEALVGTNARDDVAVLVAKIGELDATTATRRLRRWQANANDETRIRKIRTELLEEIYFTHHTEETVFRCEMVLGELIGNVVRHTPGPIEIVLERRRGSTVFHVLDSGDGFQFVPRLPLDAYSERGRGLYIAAQLSDDFSVTRRPHGGSHARALIQH